MIREGRVSVNGTVATIGDRVGQAMKSRVDGRLLRLPQRTKNAAVS